MVAERVWFGGQPASFSGGSAAGFLSGEGRSRVGDHYPRDDYRKPAHARHHGYDAGRYFENVMDVRAGSSEQSDGEDNYGRIL